MLRPFFAAVPLTISVLLAGCGGGGSSGGGGGGGGSPTTPVVTPALSFNPATVTGSVVAGTALASNVIATVARPADFANATVYAMVVDTAGVLQPNVQLVRDSDTQYHALLQTSATLAANNYQGSFSVRLCRDSACASQFPGSPVALPYNITVTPAGATTFSAVPAMPLTSTAQAGGAAPASVTVAVNATGRSWTAAGSSNWLKVSPASGTGNASLTVSYDISGLTQGQYASDLILKSNDNQTLLLPVSLTVLPPALVLGQNSLTFNAINGAPTSSQVVSLDTSPRTTTDWTASSNAPWLSVSPTAGSTPATTVVTVNPAIGPLASGTHSAAIVITPKGTDARTLPVTLQLSKAQLQFSSSTLTLGGTYGRDFSTSQPLKLGLNTGKNSWPWNLATLPAWATASVTSGTVNEDLTSLTFKANPASVAVGTTTQTSGAVAQVNGDAVLGQLLLTINKDQHKLLPAETAVALVSTPSWKRLTRTISVVDNFGSFTSMNAASDAAWLSVTINNDKLTLTANDSAMANDTLSTATVTIVSPDADVTVPEKIRVTLWKGKDTPSAISKASGAYTTVITDPLRPYAYAHNGGAYIDIYNLYTGLKEASITGLSSALGNMAIAPDGDLMYVVDLNTSRITTVNLSTRAISAQIPLAAASTSSTRLRLIRPNGVRMLLLSDGQLYLTSDNSRLANLPLSAGVLSASGDGKRVVQLNEDGASVQYTTVSVDYAALNKGTLFAAQVPAASHVSPGTLGQDIWVGSDGVRVFSALATPKSCAIMNAADLGIVGYMASGDAAPNNIEVGVDGRIFCGGATKTSNSDIYSFDSTGKLLKQYKLGAVGKQLLPRQMAVSGDGWIVAGITDDGVLSFLPVGP
ncbi:quinoprotein amine dehydrogenase [Duganella sp. sic0402]|uniref:BACON domain-containing protein n=1 Tax=Duganella sp. sic0402 TaxID=2854786 RepID=UPI001C45A48B|nr:quinoprotein amine dehydrogenase [Duganella sp. sic0402]MBV7537260.1 quinoprotein amine dehydrogenase [Duganella sp. sic0402]